MNANEMVITARLASHYEKKHEAGDEAMEHAEADIRKFKKEAPQVWKHLWDNSKMSSREIGDWIYEFVVRWSKSGMSFKNYAADWTDENLK